jgi:hypothetical protein
MSKVMRKALATALSITATDIQAPIKLDDTPFMGGKGRSGYLGLQAAVGGSGSIKVQGHNGDENGTSEPAEDDSGWFDIVTLTSASPLSQEIELPLYIRTNVTVVGTGTITAWLDGVQ